METEEFIKRFKVKLTAWYLAHKDDYTDCETSGPYDDRKPDRDIVFDLIDETLREIEASSSCHCSPRDPCKEHNCLLQNCYCETKGEYPK